jgi:hypothetical protein
MDHENLIIHLLGVKRKKFDLKLSSVIQILPLNECMSYLQYESNDDDQNRLLSWIAEASNVYVCNYTHRLKPTI